VYHLARILAASAFNGLLLGGSDADAKAYADRAADLLHEVDDPQSRAFLLPTSDSSRCSRATVTPPTPHSTSNFGSGRDQLTPRYAHDGLKGLAAVAATRRDDRRCARLVGAAAVHAVNSALPDPVDLRLDTDFFNPARERLRTDAWTDAVRHGSNLQLEDAITYALGAEHAQREPT
jgi:hypothetical protein